MPYRRTYRKRSYRRRPVARSYGVSDYAAMAASAYRGVKYLKSLVNVEKHPHDVNTSVNPDATTGVFTLLNGVGQGDAAGDRNGNSILMRSININLKYTINASATNTTIRTILFWDKECNGSTPVAGDFLQNVSAMGNYNHDEASRFTMIYDKRISLSISGTQESSRRIYRKLQRHTHYDGASNAITDMVDYSLWLFMISDEGTNTPTVQFRSQVLFIDN